MLANNSHKCVVSQIRILNYVFTLLLSLSIRFLVKITKGKKLRAVTANIVYNTYVDKANVMEKKQKSFWVPGTVITQKNNLFRHIKNISLRSLQSKNSECDSVSFHHSNYLIQILIHVSKMLFFTHTFDYYLLIITYTYYTGTP